MKKAMTNWRWWICLLLFVATTVNYMDRQVLSLTWKDYIAPEFHWTDSDYGIITGFFSIFYATVGLLPVVLLTGWVPRKVSFGPSVYGHLVHVCMPVVVGQL